MRGLSPPLSERDELDALPYQNFAKSLHDRNMAEIRDMDISEFAENVSGDVVTGVTEQLADAYTDELDSRLRAAAAEGYDYLYVAEQSMGTMPLGQPGSADTFGLETYTTANDIPPEDFLPTLRQEYGSARAYDLSDLSDGERELLDAGFIPARLLKNHK